MKKLINLLPALLVTFTGLTAPAYAYTKEQIYCRKQTRLTWKAKIKFGVDFDSAVFYRNCMKTAPQVIRQQEEENRRFQKAKQRKNAAIADKINYINTAPLNELFN